MPVPVPLELQVRRPDGEAFLAPSNLHEGHKARCDAVCTLPWSLLSRAGYQRMSAAPGTLDAKLRPCRKRALRPHCMEDRSQGVATWGSSCPCFGWQKGLTGGLCNLNYIRSAWQKSKALYLPSQPSEQSDSKLCKFIREAKSCRSLKKPKLVPSQSLHTCSIIEAKQQSGPPNVMQILPIPTTSPQSPTRPHDTVHQPP